MAKIDVYYRAPSPPCRSVIMTLNILKIPYNLKELNLLEGEHLKPEFLAINPQHCIPTIVDTETNFNLWESRAIMTYLVNKFAPGSPLYPTEPRDRAIVDRLLYFDIGTLYKAIMDVVYPMFKGEFDPEKEKVLREKIELLNGFLDGQKYVAGDQLTLADYAIYASLTFLGFMDFDFSPTPNVKTWMDRLATEVEDNENVNVKPIEWIKDFLKAKNAPVNK